MARTPSLKSFAAPSMTRTRRCSGSPSQRQINDFRTILTFVNMNERETLVPVNGKARARSSTSNPWRFSPAGRERTDMSGQYPPTLMPQQPLAELLRQFFAPPIQSRFLSHAAHPAVHSWPLGHIDTIPIRRCTPTRILTPARPPCHD